MYAQFIEILMYRLFLPPRKHHRLIQIHNQYHFLLIYLHSDIIRYFKYLILLPRSMLFPGLPWIVNELYGINLYKSNV